MAYQCAAYSVRIDEKRSRNLLERILAIETSCDDTSVAVVGRDGFVFALKSASQDLVHRPFGGVVPEIAGRNHSETLLPLIDSVVDSVEGKWSAIEGIAVTNRPGLLGSLLVGVVTTKALGLVKKLPFLGVNHLEGHIFAPFLKDQAYQPNSEFSFPFLSLAVSGGHTTIYRVDGLGQYRVLGTTRDDAAGEAFDKFAKMLGLPFPGGIQVDRLSKGGDIKAFSFPRGMMEEGNLDFSFSGVKSSAQRLVQSLSQTEKRERISDLCASFQDAVATTLIEKLDRAVRKENIKNVTITGGVSANSRLRELAQSWASSNNIKLMIPPLKFCTDNAAMIGYVGIQRFNQGESDNQYLAPSPEGPLG